MDAKWQFLAKGLGAAVLLAAFAQNGMAGKAAQDGPESVELSSLQNLYQPVSFDHAMHSGAAACAACHHHTTGTPAVDEPCRKCHQDGKPVPTVSCAGCHPPVPGNAWGKIQSTGGSAAVFHLEVAGLRRAYHVRCVGCHQEMGAATGCEDCHAKLDKRG